MTEVLERSGEVTDLMPRRRARLPGLDGLRAIAVGGVVLYHLGTPWVRGGFLGVDLFFVVSGFLITTLLVEEKSTSGGIGLGNFWLRRARRLLPALVAMIVCVMAYVIIAGRAGNQTVGQLDLQNLRGDGFATLLYVANWHLIATAQSYFNQFSTPSPLLHTWSLAIEEQFYILWPLAVIGFLSFKRRPWRPWAIGVALVGALASAVAMSVLFTSGHDITRVYYGTDTRAFDLLIGAALAFFTVNRHRRASTIKVLRLAGLPALIGVVAFFVVAGTPQMLPRTQMFQGGFLIFALLAALLIASCVFVPDGVLTQVLSLRVLVAVGVVSYGVYLWHWPIIVFVNADSTHLTGITLALVRLGLIAAFTCASFFLLEQPIRFRRVPRSVRRLLYPGGIILVVIMILVATTPTLVSPPLAVARYFNPATVIPGVGGISGQAPIKLGFRPTHMTPLRVEIFGDSMPYVASPGIVAALETTGVVTVANYTFPGWGTSTIPDWQKGFGQGVRDSHAQIVIGTWRWDQTLALEHPKAYAATLRQMVSIARANGALGVVLLGYPLTDVEGDSRAQLRATEKGEEAWAAVASSLPAQMPGQVMWFPIAPSVELDGHYSAWLPPLGEPHAPASEWERVRRLDGIHLCVPGIQRYATALADDMLIAFRTRLPAKTWSTAGWTHDPLLTSADGFCPDDHPSRT